MKGEKKEDKVLLRRREEWLSSIKVDGKEENLFELEVLLKATERFFSLDNLPISNRDNVMTKNFYYEIKILKQVVGRIVAVTRELLDPDEVKVFYFQSYIKNKLIKDYARDRFMEVNLQQDNPRGSLLLLFNSFANLMEILDGLSQLKRVSYILYFNLGQMVSRDIHINRFFNPFRLQAFSPFYDRITIPALQSIVNAIKDEIAKKHISITILAFNRYLKYLKFVKNESEELDILKFSLPIFSLIHSEIRALKTYIENEIPQEMDTGRKRNKADITLRKSFLSLLDSISFQINMEMKKTFAQILRDASEIHSATRLRVAIDNAKGMLTNFFQQTIVSIAQLAKNDIRGAEIFPDFVSKLEQSMRLREDVWILHECVFEVEKLLSDDPPPVPKIKRAFDSLSEFISYFKNLSYNLIRFSDIEDFNRFFQQVDEFSDKDFTNRLQLEEFKKLTHIFRIFLSTTLSNINNRQELKNVTFDESHAREIMKQFY